jgi:NAD(P)-dependent dehydrogenase (short-subunit alcohol dehydrogenase family)
VLPPVVQAKCSPEASYLIVGGLGGIGRSVAEHLARLGAKSLILISRHAESKPQSKALVKELSQTGCYIVIKNCDVGDPLVFAKVLKECSVLPPIRGVIQAAMVLSVSNGTGVAKTIC